jgi:hypothetical protein
MLTAKLEESYRPQLQGQLYVTGRQWVDIVAFHPEMPTVVIRVERDNDYIKALDEALRGFCATLKLAREQLEAKYGKFELKVHVERGEPPVGSLGITDDDLDAIVAARFPKEPTDG